MLLLSFDNDGGRDGRRREGCFCKATVAVMQTDADCIWAETTGDVCRTVLSPYSMAR